MEKTIIDIIDKKASRQYLRMTETKRKAYRAMLYAGLQVTHNKCHLKDIATEIGYTESGTSKLVQKWIELMKSGDIMVNVIIHAYQKLPEKKKFQHYAVVKDDSTSPTIRQADIIQPTVNAAPSPIPIKIPRPKPTTKILLGGFVITPEDERRERAAIRASILFFQSYGKGQKPRLRGEYYTPGTNPDDVEVDEGKWLPLESAALYCGCKESIINAAGQNGTIERRVYRRNSNRNYYEYRLEDLDRFIKTNHLM